MTDALAAIAASWGVLMALSPLLHRLLALHAYGIALRNLAIIVPNSVAFLVGAATIAIAFRYRGSSPEAHRPW